MLRNPQLVYDKAEENLPRVQANIAAIVEEERARASAPKVRSQPVSEHQLTHMRAKLATIGGRCFSRQARGDACAK